MSTSRAVLTRVRGVHRHAAPTGPCCIVGEVGCELAPRRASDALGNAWVAKCLARLHAAKERLEGQIKAQRDILEHLRLHAGQYRTLHVQRGQRRLLLVESHRLLPLLLSITAFGQQMVIQPATLLQLLVEETLLLFVRLQAVLERLTQVAIAT